MKCEDWVQTYSGKKFYPLNPRIEDIDIIDIAHALSLICRYNGHCKELYTVAEHSIYVAESLDPHIAIYGLLHDAAEAYLPDVARPIKPLLKGFKEIENKVLSVIFDKFKLYQWGEVQDKIHKADLSILADEADQVMGSSTEDWYLPESPIGTKIYFLSSKGAEMIFLLRFKQYMEESEIL